MEFEIGDKIVYPSHGVGIIERIAIQNFSGTDVKVYQLRLQETNSTVLVPINNVCCVGLRRIISRQDIQGLVEQMQMVHPELNAREKDWKNRFKENTEKMKSGKLSDLVEVLVTLAQLNSRKTLSFREKKMYDRAKRLLITEIAAAENSAETAVEERVDQALHNGVGCHVPRGV